MTLQLDEAMAQLRCTPAVLRAWLGDLPEAWLVADEGPDTFSPRKVLAHLISGERSDWLIRVRIILEHGEARPFDPFDRHGFLAEAETWALNDLLQEFERLRAANLAALAALKLGEVAFTQRGTHPALGVVTLEQLLSTWVVHDLGHIAQIARVMAKRYKADVGPWVDYLPVLTRV
ncbi:MAG TPA: DinB family protein [Geothrix sp.]|nr:DinB family protein [Geothrix sp.]